MVSREEDMGGKEVVGQMLVEIQSIHATVLMAFTSGGIHCWRQFKTSIYFSAG